MLANNKTMTPKIPKEKTKLKGTGIMELVVGVIALVVLGVALVVGLKINTGVQSTLTAGTTEYNATVQVASGIGSISTWIPIIALVLVSAFIIGYLVSKFMSSMVGQHSAP